MPVVVNSSLSRFALLPFILLGALPFCRSLAEDEFDLAIDATELVGGPFLELVQELGRDSEKEWLSVAGHPAV